MVFLRWSIWPPFNSTIERQIKSTIKKEFPIHEDLLFERIKHHWNMKNATQKFKVHIEWLAGRSGAFRDRKGFYWPTKNSKITRYRNTGLHRSPKHVSDEEVSLVFDAIFERSHRTLDKSELFTLTAMAFSWGKKTSVVTNRLEAALKKWGEKDALRK